MKRIVSLLAMLAMVALVAAPALAKGPPENPGVETGTDHANSICAFSGLNDEPDDPVEGGRVQSYGQIVKAGGKAEVPSPGFACNAHLFPYPPGPPPPPE